MNTGPRKLSRTDPDDAIGGGFDLAVIGAGSAGFSAAITGAELGARVALIGHGTIGGTCVNVGCVPSKTLIRAMEALHRPRSADRFRGIEAQSKLRDWGALVAQKGQLVEQLRRSRYTDLLPEYDGITYLEGPARLTADGLAVNGTVLSPRKLIITTGASPAVPDIAGIDGVECLTSTTALALDRLPRSLLVIGGGYVGCELAQLFARAGVAVTIATRRRLLPVAEPEISDALTGCFRDEGITVRDGLSYRSIRDTGDGVALVVEVDGVEETIAAQMVLASTGRRPNTRGLGLEEASVELLPNGGIRVDDRMRSSRPGIYAAGDVTGRDQFVYMAAHGARIAAENALNGDRSRYDNAAMPAIVFTDPQVASVGLTEAEARDGKLTVRTSVLPLEHLPRALAARDTRGLVKLVADAGSGRLLGAHILAPEGGDSIQTAALALRHKMTTAELAETVFPYLTTVEGLKLAAQAFEKDVTRLSCCAG